ncbi:MAG: MFS transporter [Patescibacteria group bacterium]
MMHNEHFNRNKVHLVSLVAFMLGFLDAFSIYILSSYFATVIGSDNVGVFYLIAYSGVLLALFYLQPLIRIIGKARALYLFLGITILASVMLTRLDVSWSAIAIILIFMMALNVTLTTLDIFLESFSKDQLSGRIRGRYLTIVSVGFLVAPILATSVLERSGYGGIFFILVLGYIAAFLVALIGFRNDNGVFQEKILLRQTLRKMMREKNLLRIYHISFTLDFFYAMMVVYTPLYLRSLGYAWNEIGIIFTLMLVPFVILQYPVGILADKRLGEKELLIGSILIAAVTTGALGFLDTHNLWIWGGALFLTRIGIAGLSVLRDSYFYKQIDGDNMDVIAFFRTALPMANIFGALFAAILLVFFPLQSIFFAAAGMLFLSLFSAGTLEDTKSERELRA